eukprot:CAMPEP_0113323998 /NCGR_PEP_ID=MMETSP0010_2-20120614/16733_1 /TAXON_ID=216773 ORGANISM="Corethron hystrix, Strain 308" /NCGR_SAMPLE_ID=MMETSP0010_2 /ASSEMBLY_ACC=CAM_ASM_000155 /LENGTH=96 /DNA_ID=CAMNT_0000183193 /DNA_START=59 /DNA_END=346 /DNA_ORIENTATION=+ /assembly_acc=CAM_ASM_000155
MQDGTRETNVPATPITRGGRKLSFLDAVPSMGRRHRNRVPIDQDDPVWARKLDDEDRAQTAMETSSVLHGGTSVASHLSRQSRQNRQSHMDKLSLP